jgi:uncharacterized membrane protein YfcA
LLLDATTLALVAAAAMVAAIVSGVGGFGTGVILAALLAPLIGIKAVIPVLAVAGVVINAGRFWFYRTHLDRRILVQVLAVSIPFLVLGTWIYSVLDVRALGTLLGIVVIGSIPLRRFLKQKQIRLNATGLAVGSGVFGLATGTATGTGVIMVTLLLGTGMPGTAVLATDALISIVLDLCKAALFHRFALLDSQSLSTGLVIGVATIPGSAVAAWLVTRMHAHLHILFMEALILIGGVSLIVNAWR